MNNRVNHVLATLLAAAGCAGAHAATYYVADCQVGAAAGCVAGNDANNGTSAGTPWRTTAKVESVFSSLSAGDTILFAKGGAWTDSQMLLQNFNATALNPITFDSYTPSAWSSSAKPILTESRPNLHGIFTFDAGGAPTADGGYVVQNFELRGGGVGSWGVLLTHLVHDVTLTNLTIDGLGVGVNCMNDVERVKLQNSVIRNSTQQGVLWSCNNSQVENNTFDNNGTTLVNQWRYHTAYISGEAATNIAFRGNNITNNAHDASGSCVSAVVVAHGVQDGLTIENNKIYEASGTAGLGCWGIVVDAGYAPADGETYAESFENVVIRGNTVVNVGGVGIGCASCIEPLIENNVIVQESTPDLRAIAVPNRQTQLGDAVDTGGTIRNNSIYFATTPAYSEGISLTYQHSSAYPLLTAGTNVKVVSNLIWFGSGSNNHRCFDTTGMVIGDFTAFANNLCYHAGGNGRWSYAYASLGAAQTAGFDAGGMSADPQLLAVPASGNNWSMALQLGSPAINAGNATHSAPNDRAGVGRCTPDIGAHEYTCSP